MCLLPRILVNVVFGITYAILYKKIMAKELSSGTKTLLQNTKEIII